MARQRVAKSSGAKDAAAAEPAKAAAAVASTRTLAWIGGGILGVLAVSTALLWLAAPELPSGPATGPASLAKPALADAALLTHFSAEHNASLLWGTYRPGVYFGVKSRTSPEAVVAGLMWTSVGKGGRIDGSRLRHTCEEAETREGLHFGYTEHDGRAYATQVITDPQLQVELKTSFLKHSHHHWTMRVTGASSKGKKALFFYVGIDDEFAPQDAGRLALLQPAEKESPALLHGATRQLGSFALTAVTSSGAVDKVVAWIAAPGTPVVRVKDALLERLKGGSGNGRQDGAARLLESANSPDLDAATQTKLIVLQLVVESSFEIDFDFHGGLEDSGIQDAAAAAVSSSPKLAAKLEQMSSDFEERFEETFHLRAGGKASDEQIRFAQAAMSAMLGGLGFFYGRSKIKTTGDEFHMTDAIPLFTAVPSRSFFPRGFLWDEGFHQLLVGRWDADLSRDVLAHWFGLMHGSGWIPREQILGAEAIAKVPEWALAQHPTHANPPTFLLAIESLLSHASSDENHAWLEALFPAVERWFRWFLESQSGELPRSFRWHGRDPGDGKLNAMTLSSGLDDYPRAAAVSDSERHVDLHSWIAFGAGVLARVGQRAGLPRAKVEEYRRMQTELITSLDEMHWDERNGRYSDFGLHCNDGSYEKFVVVKCGTPDGGSSVEHGVSVKTYQRLASGRLKQSPCPADFPRFLFPLGDGSGGLLQREKFVAKKEALQFVNHTGYVSLFPLFLRLLSPDSPRLGQVLDLLGDPAKGLWSDYGIRSLARGDKMYLRPNAPGDAPYWRGPIWINCNFLAVSALSHYAQAAGPHREKAAALHEALSRNLVRNLFDNFQRTGFLWEQYNPQDGTGQRTHPFNGWSSLVVLIMAS